MKIVLLSLIISLTITLNAQQWCSAGSVWHFNTSNPTFNTTYTKHTYLYDTIVNSKTFNKIASETHGNGVMGPINNYGNFYTSLQNNIVFFNSSNYGQTPLATDTLICFGPVGSKWRVQPNGGTSCEQSYIEIIETGNSLVQGLNLNWYKINYKNYYMFGTPNQYLQTGIDTIFDRIGYKHLAFQFLGHCADATDVGTSSLNCFSDNLISIKTVTTNCDLTSGLEEFGLNEENEFSIYPNPANEILNVFSNDSITNPYILTISNRLGEVVSSNAVENTKQFTLKTNNLRSGIYFITITQNNKQFSRKLIINKN